MVCPKCKSQNIQTSTYAEKNRRGCIMTLLLILLCCTIVGLFFAVPLLRGKKDKVKTMAVCHDCGHKWKV